MLRSPWSPAALMLVLMMAVGSVIMWIGVPLGLIYVASQIAGSSRPSAGPYLLILLGCRSGWRSSAVPGDSIASTAASPGAHESRRRATWLRSMRGERSTIKRGGVLDEVMMVSVGVAVIAFAVWFLGFAGSSPSLGFGKASGAARRISRVQVIVLGIDPGVANTGYGVVAHAAAGSSRSTAGSSRPSRARRRRPAGGDPSPCRRADGRL